MSLIRRMVKILNDPDYDVIQNRRDQAEDEARLEQMRRLQRAQNALAEVRSGLIELRHDLGDETATLGEHRIVLQ